MIQPTWFLHPRIIPDFSPRKEGGNPWKQGVSWPSDATFYPLDWEKSLKNELREVLLDPVSLKRGLFRPETVRQLIDEHVEGKREHSFRLWALLMLELWFRRHLDG